MTINRIRPNIYYLIECIKLISQKADINYSAYLETNKFPAQVNLRAVKFNNYLKEIYANAELTQPPNYYQFLVFAKPKTDLIDKKNLFVKSLLRKSVRIANSKSN